jgi:uncharacterized membrane protein
MTHKRPTPMQRWSRPLMAGIATLGATTTAYLTYTKLTGNNTACPTAGCDLVLSSPYATLFGLPLALFGLLAYIGIAILAIAPLLINAASHHRHRLEQWTGWLLFIGTTAMLVFSGYLMALLAFEFKTVCVYCLASALCSTLLFILAIAGRPWPDIGQLVFTGTIVAMVTLVATLGSYAQINQPAIANAGVESPAIAGLPITTPASTAEIALAQHLNQTGAKFYGAFWCQHCHEQKQLFGQAALSALPYVECSTPNRQEQTAICDEQKINSYPTWKIGGQSFSGLQSLEQLAQLSGYQGPRNFQNIAPN